jgi:ribonucleoside-diphosphate reductase alpha chain
MEPKNGLVDPDVSYLPDYFADTDSLTPVDHINIQAAAQKWVDSSISKTINVPTNISFEDFQNIYMYAYDKKLKGCTTFRFNPENFQGVLVKTEDLKSTGYRFTLEDGSNVDLTGDEMVEYRGQTQTAANLFDAIKENYFGKY